MYIGFSMFMYLSVCVNCFTGAYEVFHKIPYIKYSIFMMLGSSFVFLFVLGVLGTLLTRDITKFTEVIASLIGAYISCKSVDYIDKKMNLG